MYSFSQKSLQNLGGCHVDLQSIFHEVIKVFDCSIVEGFRGKEAQEKAFKEGKTKLHFPYGKHNKYPSMAVDVYPYPIDFNNKQSFHDLYELVKGISIQLKARKKISHDIRWGGAWDGELNKPGQLDDLCHYELITIE